MNFTTKNIFFLFVFLLCIGSIQSQNTILDSLENELSIHTEKDTIRVNTLNAIIYEVFKEDTDKAKGLIKEVELLSKKLDFVKGKADALFFKGQIEIQERNYTKSISYFNESMDLQESINNKIGVSSAYTGIGTAYAYQQDYDKAIANYQKSAVIYEEINDLKGTAGILNNIANVYKKIGRYDEALINYTKSKAIKKKLNDLKGVASSYKNIGLLYHRQSDFPKALESFNEALNISKNNGDLSMQAEMLNSIGAVYYAKGNFDEAITSLKKSYAIRVQMDEKELGLSVLNNLGTICLNQGRYTEALEYLNQCLYIYREGNDKQGIALSTYNMSAVYYELKQYDKTLKNLEEALLLYKELNNKDQIASCLSNKGAVYADLKRFPEALTFITESLKISEEINDVAELSAGYFQLGDLRLLMGQPKMALKSYQTCLDLSLSIENKIYTCHAHIGLANSLVALNNYSKALYHALEGGKIAKDLELLQQQKLVAEVLAKVYEKTNNYKKALASHQEYKALSDSLFNKENIEKRAQLEYEYKHKKEVDEASYRELLLTQQVETTSNDLEKSQQNLLLGVIAFLLVTLVLGLIIFFLKLRNVKSEAQNIAIEQKLLRSQMTPHFIFNSLSVLQGMILNKEEKKAVSYLSKFSKLLRIILENSRDKTVSLSQELTAVENYLTLQNVEETQAFKYTVEVDNGIDKSQFKIPPMLIQPFIENAIEHAFEGQIENKKIDIHLSYIDEKLICTINDNGIGVDAQKTHQNQDKKSLATTITSERLEILSKDFNMKGSVSVEDKKKKNEKGTLVTLVIPYKIQAA